MSTLYTKHAFGLCPAADVAGANALLETAGFGPNNFRVPLVLNQDLIKTTTHYGCHWVMTDAEYAMLQASLAPFGVTWDASRGRVGESPTRESDWMAANGVKKQEAARSEANK